MLTSPRTAPLPTLQEETIFSSFSRAASKIPGVTATVGYVSPPERVGRTIICTNHSQVTPWQNCEYRMSPVRIADARAMTSPPNIHVEGYELWDAPTSMVNFDDEDGIRSRYYAEAAELAKCATGARHAYIFDHLVRRREKGRSELGFGRKDSISRPSAVGRVHNDYSEASGQKPFELLAANRQIPPAQRFAIVNIWRSIRRQDPGHSPGALRRANNRGERFGGRRYPLSNSLR